jgi:hypothetical protein
MSKMIVLLPAPILTNSFSFLLKAAIRELMVKLESK